MGRGRKKRIELRKEYEEEYDNAMQSLSIEEIFDDKLSGVQDFEVSSFIDPRDGRTYPTIRIAGEIWMAENLDFALDEDSWHYDNNASVLKYGRLYTFESAKKACPPGWGMPTEMEWNSLIEYFENSRGKAYEALISGGSCGFNAQLGGFGRNRISTDNFSYKGGFYFSGITGFYWTCTSFNDDDAWYYHFGSGTKTLDRLYGNKALGFSCRCIRSIK